MGNMGCMPEATKFKVKYPKIWDFFIFTNSNGHMDFFCKQKWRERKFKNLFSQTEMARYKIWDILFLQTVMARSIYRKPGKGPQTSSVLLIQVDQKRLWIVISLWQTWKLRKMSKLRHFYKWHIVRFWYFDVSEKVGEQNSCLSRFC